MQHPFSGIIVSLYPIYVCKVACFPTFGQKKLPALSVDVRKIFLSGA